MNLSENFESPGERNNRLIDAAPERLRRAVVENMLMMNLIVLAGALFALMSVIPAGSLLSRTQKLALILMVPSPSRLSPVFENQNLESFSNVYHKVPSFRLFAFLNCYAVRTTKDYGYNEDSLMESIINPAIAAPGNIVHVSSPSWLWV